VLQRESKMVDDAFDPMNSLTFKIFRSQPQRQMRPPFDGIQILRYRLEGPAQSLQFRKGICQNIRHTKKI
jgi:hypothetical protein